MDKINIREYLKSNILYLDGGMGTLLQERGLAPGEQPERWNITRPDEITAIHRAYIEAGSNVINTNTFGANVLHFSEEELDEIIKHAVENVRAAGQCLVALDIGPTGRMLAPYGDLDFEDAVEIFAKTVRQGQKYGVDLIFIETMNDSYETKAALLAAKENSDKPVFVSCAYGADGKLMTGATPAAMVAMLEGMGADAIGINCSLGPEALAPVAREYLKYSSVPVLFKPNAGLPRAQGARTVYDVAPEEFAEQIKALVSEGVRAVGGCCGTTPEYIRVLKEYCSDVALPPLTEKNFTSASSYTRAVFFDNRPILIGERINPTGKKRVKQAYLDSDLDYIIEEALSQQDRGAHVLDVNAGLPGIDERAVLSNTVKEIQAVCDLPLQIDTTNAEAMESALRLYNGKAMVNSVNGKEESMHAVFPLVKKYGGVLIALTLDEEGIPESAERRLEIAEKILTEAEKYGIKKKDIIFDPLAMTVSADTTAAEKTLKAVSLITHSLGCRTSLGVSNISFGLPERDEITSVFFALAMREGLSCAIMNPYSERMMRAYHSYLALSGLDENCSEYISLCTPRTSEDDFEGAATLRSAVIRGMRDRAASLTVQALKTREPLDVVTEEIIPALNEVGVGYENKTVYLPQLLMSAEAAKAGFDVIKNAFPSRDAGDKCRFVIATVKGDIHDIGKNIVRLLLENYGFNVTDLGRDVPPEEVVRETVRLHAPLVGLSALMTTTVPAMEETIKQLRVSAPWCKVVVGGAVLNEEYARAIGADTYARDAMETVRYSLIINDSLEKSEKSE